LDDWEPRAGCRDVPSFDVGATFGPVSRRARSPLPSGVRSKSASGHAAVRCARLTVDAARVVRFAPAILGRPGGAALPAWPCRAIEGET